jgi:hypothetical protein
VFGFSVAAHLNRSFDLACVAALPLVFVDLAPSRRVRFPTVPWSAGLVRACVRWMGALDAATRPRIRRASGPARRSGADAVAGLGHRAVASRRRVQTMRIADNPRAVSR